MKPLRTATKRILELWKAGSIKSASSGTPEAEWVCDAFVALEDALDEPLRNCDVGSVVEQTKRLAAFCYARRNMTCCGNCPADGVGNCELAWAQLPYEGER